MKGETDPVSPFEKGGRGDFQKDQNSPFEKGGRGDFPVLSVKVFTTRPDTIFGASYLVLAPEHPLVAEITTAEYSEQVNDYIKKASVKSDLERAELAKEKTGIFTGAYAINPANKKLIPIWIADYVLAHYGTGAIMAVPAHDSRDFEFARAFNLPIPQVLKPVDGSEWNFDEAAFVDDGIACNSSFEDFSIDGLGTDEAIQKAIEWVENSCIGKGKVQYKLRDWLFSRQRYWGEPIPIMFFEDGTRRCLDTDELPLVLPDVKEFKPAGTGESPLATVDEWVNFIDKKTGKHARFETNTMPQWAGSCWYYLRYLDPNNSDIFCSKENDEYWMSPGGVDLYMGGAEHAVLHLLYARFWHKLLFDYGYVSTVEPFKKLYHQGLILGEDGRKMSKSLGNVVNPDIMVAKYGADALRIFEMFLGPLADSKPWSEKGMEGTNRFLNRVWRLIATEEGALSNDVQEIPLTADQEYHLNCTIKKVGEDIEELHFNTAVSQMMIFVNEFTKADIKPHAAMEKFVLCLAPFAPHIAEELWGILGKAESIVLANYPEYDPAKTIRAEVELVVQVTSKIRAKIQVPLDLSQGEAENIARADEKVAKYLEGNQIKKIIYVKNKIINFIV
ncbi:MAG: leucine--tRNA ligase [Candidatus Kapabacteria bacterium]|nr:leucine--tRNA ligase [Candidatus Kapabacteria bacterium]